MNIPRVLIIAGSDSGGGAGIQADIKAVTCLGGFATTAITALTAQNTTGVQDICPIPPQFVRSQIASVLEDIGTDTIKTGMLFSAEIIEAVAAELGDKKYTPAPLILDPVMVAKGGAALLKPEAVSAMVQLLFPRARLVTPNIPEAELLSGMKITHLPDMHGVADKILQMGPEAVLIKGGHLEGDDVTDLLADRHGNHTVFVQERIESRNTHGTGCTLASGIATGLAQKMTIEDAVERSQAYVYEAIAHAPGYGTGHGPMAHNFILMEKG